MELTWWRLHIESCKMPKIKECNKGEPRGLRDKSGQTKENRTIKNVWTREGPTQKKGKGKRNKQKKEKKNPTERGKHEESKEDFVKE